MLRITLKTDAAEQKLHAVEFALKDPAFREPLERAAWRAHRDLVQLTPKKWTGNTRKAWSISSPLGDRGAIRVHNDSKAMLYLEKGTDMVNPDGRIYPKVKKWLYIPLRPGAMVWRQGLKYGKDYILRRSVKGIKARNIVENYRPFAGYILRAEMKAYLERFLR